MGPAGMKTGLGIACNTVNKMYCHLTSCCCIADILGGGAMDKH